MEWSNFLGWGRRWLRKAGRSSTDRCGQAMDISKLIVVSLGLGIIFTQGCAADETEVSSSVPRKCLEVIHSYVKKTRRWEPDTYVVDGESLGTEGLGFSIWLLRETEVPGPPGGGESFHVDLDHGCSRVTGELGYQ